MPAGDVNTITVLGRDLLLVEVGVGAETHLARESDDEPGRLAVEAAEGLGSPVAEPRWQEATMCGRRWQAMAAGPDDLTSFWRSPAFAPTCRSCLRVVDSWFPVAATPAGVHLLAAVVAEQVVEFSSVYVTGIPAEHLEATRRAIRKALRSNGFRSGTHAVDGLLAVWSDDAYQAIDPAVLNTRLNSAIQRIGLAGEAGDRGDAEPPPGPIDWHTWVVDS